MYFLETVFKRIKGC